VSINSFEVNPLDVLKCRKVNYLPSHFKTAEIEYSSITEIEKWIKDKLQGRYCITKNILFDNEDKMQGKIVAGFEKHTELTYFMLACPHIRR
jgi:hypothetical protein